jgi:hypothetical protein
MFSSAINPQDVRYWQGVSQDIEQKMRDYQQFVSNDEYQDLTNRYNESVFSTPLKALNIDQIRLQDVLTIYQNNKWTLFKRGNRSILRVAIANIADAVAKGMVSVQINDSSRAHLKKIRTRS